MLLETFVLDTPPEVIEPSNTKIHMIKHLLEIDKCVQNDSYIFLYFQDVIINTIMNN